MLRHSDAQLLIGLLGCPAANCALAVAERGRALRIGVVGLDTSHAAALLELFNGPGEDRVPGGTIVAAVKGGSPDIEASRTRVDRFAQIAVEQFGVQLFESIEEMARAVDAVMILSVDGRAHRDQFRRVAGTGKPVFIDKPMGGSLADALQIATWARKTATPCFSSSALRYAPDSVVARLEAIGELTGAISIGPAPRESHHPDLFWYGIHATEALFTVLGSGCVEVVRSSSPVADVVTGVWTGGRVGTLHGTRTGSAAYSVTAIGTKGLAMGGQIHSYRPLAQAIMTFFQTRIAPVPLDMTIEIHAFMEAADESLRRGGSPVTLAEVIASAAVAR